MALDPIPASYQSDGNWTITYVPDGSNAKSIAILNGSSAKDVTYSFTPDGFNYGINEAEVTDGRLTLKQVLSRAGKVTETLEIKYVDTDDADSAAVLFTEGLIGKFVVRRRVANGTAYTVSHKADIISFQLGKQRPNAPTENGVDTISQKVYFVSATEPKATLVA